MEERQILCRDESIEGVRYFPNFFSKYCDSIYSTKAVSHDGKNSEDIF
jgi:hypothetical protein